MDRARPRYGPHPGRVAPAGGQGERRSQDRSLVPSFLRVLEPGFVRTIPWFEARGADGRRPDGTAAAFAQSAGCESDPGGISDGSGRRELDRGGDGQGGGE